MKTRARELDLMQHVFTFIVTAAWFAEQGLCICQASVRLFARPFVCPVWPPHAAAADRRSATAASQRGAQQQMRVVPRCQQT